MVVEEEFKDDDTNNGLLNSSGLVCDSRDKRRCLWTQILVVLLQKLFSTNFLRFF